MFKYLVKINPYSTRIKSDRVPLQSVKNRNLLKCAKFASVERYGEIPSE